MSATTTIYDKNNPFLAKMTEKFRLSKEGSAKETYHMVVDISGSGLTYTCGDSLAVFPTNPEQDVREVLAVSGFTGDEEVELPRDQERMTVREALFRKFAFAQLTKKFLQFLLSIVIDPVEKARLERLLSPESAEEMKRYLEERELPDLLAEYSSAKFSPQELVDQLRKLNPRLYSIASSPVVHPEEIHLTVVVLRYQTNDRKRSGVCTSYLSDRVELNQPVIPVFVSSSKFGLPENPQASAIMVGPGTGIAPFRAFLQERAATGASGKNWVFFGEQHRASDYFYEEEWQAWEKEGKLSRIDLAFSRDQTHKIYVQDRLRENATEIWKWISEGAYFYVCGDAKRMAKDVDVTLHQIISQEGKLSEEEAINYVKQMKKDRRYQRDVY